jgi:hypothetical protein
LSTSVCRKWETKRSSGNLNRSASMRVGMRSSQTPALGNIAGGRECTHILRRYVGQRAIDSDKLPIGCVFRIGRNIGMRTRSRSRTRFSLRRGTRSACSASAPVRQF